MELQILVANLSNEMFMSMKLGSSVKPSGISPVKELLDKFKYKRYLNVPIQYGMDPPK
jgi:hypothetical protein